MEILTGRVIYPGNLTGDVLHSTAPIGFFGNVDAETGIIKEKGHPLWEECIADKILVFPYAKGSTVGSYILYALKKRNRAPRALVMGQCEIIVAVGAIIAEIPAIDKIDINLLHTGDIITIDGDKITIERTPLH